MDTQSSRWSFSLKPTGLKLPTLSTVVGTSLSSGAAREQDSSTSYFINPALLPLAVTGSAHSLMQRYRSSRYDWLKPGST